MVWAFLLSLSFYPGSFGFLAWLSLVRPIIILSKLKGRTAFNAAYFFSFFFNLFSIYWVAMVTPPGMVAAVVIVSFYYTAVLMLFNKLHSIKPIFGFIALPFLWTGLEYFRTLSEFAFPWSDLGYSQACFLYVLQIVSVISIHGLTLLIVIVNVLLVQVFRKTPSPERKLTSILVSLAIVAGLTAYGWVVTPRFPVDGDVDVALIQGSVPLEIKWAKNNEEHSFKLYDSLIQASADSTIKLYVWPETSVPSYLCNDFKSRKRVGNIVAKSKAPHLIGGLASSFVNKKLRYHNACYQFDSTGIIEQQYHKVKLVPFSEHVPYQDHLPFLEKSFLQKYLSFIDNYGVQWWSDFYPGNSPKLFKLNENRYGVLICFECAFPEFVRDRILDGANFMVGITNDTWFGESVGIYMHSSIFITRAVENRCWMTRTANSGLTYIVDDYGRIRDELSLNDIDVLKGKVGLLDSYSVFTRIGDIFGQFSFLITIGIWGILIVLWLKRKLIR